MKISKMKIAFASLFASAFVGTANAALTAADVTALGTEVTGDVDVVKAAVLPIIFTLVALYVGVKLLKKLTSKIG